MTARRPAVSPFQIAADDETTMVCFTCGGGFPPGTGGWRHAYPDDDVVWFHEGCAP